MITVTYEYKCDACAENIRCTEVYKIILGLPLPALKSVKSVGSLQVCNLCLNEVEPILLEKRKARA